MTQPDSPPPLPYADPPPLPPPARENRLGIALAWAVIALSVAYIVVTTALEKSSPAGTAARAGAASELQFRIATRYAVGAHQLFALVETGKGDKSDASLIESVDQAAVAADDKLRAAIVAGEILGSDAAVQRLDKLSNRGDELDHDAQALRLIYSKVDAPTVSQSQREGLISRHGWFGKLALSHGLAGDDPARREVVRPAVRTMVSLIVAVLVVLGAIALGLVLLIVAIVRRASGSLRMAYVPAAGPTGPFLEAVAAFLAAMVALSGLVRFLMGIPMAAAWFPLVLLPAVMLYPLLRGVRRDELRRGLGWHAGQGVFREIGAGVVGYLAGLPVLVLGALVTMALQRVSASDTTHPIVNEFGRGAGRTVRLLLLAAVWAPLVEETVFRGAFYHHLRRTLAWPVAALIVAVVFAAIHPQGWAAVPTLGAIAFMLAALREWRGSIIAPVVGHAINNGFITLLLVLVLA